tara:strand:+ start:41374 stop:41712 length:339 start_codon:yes stop_codon:yes gene_type:complete
MKGFNHGYRINGFIFCIDAYEDVKGDWSKCPSCNLKPKSWVFDNGKQTACGCWLNKYDHFSVKAESIMSVYHRNNGDLSEYNSDQLRLNWNEYCATMISPCNHMDLHSEDKW